MAPSPALRGEGHGGFHSIHRLPFLVLLAAILAGSAFPGSAIAEKTDLVAWMNDGGGIAAGEPPGDAGQGRETPGARRRRPIALWPLLDVRSFDRERDGLDARLSDYATSLDVEILWPLFADPTA